MGGKHSLEERTVSFFIDGSKFAGSVFGRVFQVEVASIKVIVASKCDPLPC